ncbi:Diphthine--ammonia ligase [Parasponia andersonii]|uniref:Diphthine--ammonia ligase n=1 Tax=Parasponia andersonii TaxID=3476 RepID=A0A2P5C360_PARAD|nr:Diphthine--ammonia ligase [Parasponia andersonii]
MKVVALVSGGKDSCYAMMKCLQYGHQIVALANLMPADDSVDELDSYMYQTVICNIFGFMMSLLPPQPSSPPRLDDIVSSRIRDIQEVVKEIRNGFETTFSFEKEAVVLLEVGHQIIVSYAECMGLPLFRRRIQGSTRQAFMQKLSVEPKGACKAYISASNDFCGLFRHEKLSYTMTPGDEVEDMFMLLNEVKRQIPNVTAVSSGAIASDYQRLRVESVCSRLGLVSLAYLWKQDQSLLLQEMIANGILAITVKVAAMGLDPAKHLGKDLASLNSHLHKLKERDLIIYYFLKRPLVCHVNQEFTNARIVLDEFQVILHSSDSIAPAGVLHPLAFHLEHKKLRSSSPGSGETEEICLENKGSVFEVEGDCLWVCDAASQSVAEATDSITIAENKLQISRTQKDDSFSICCWLKHPCKPSSGLQEELTAVLGEIELQLVEYGFGWENVLYIHLYIADMKEFATANETYVRFITQEKCTFGVPSRSTIELPLLQAGLGRAYVEVLVANDHTKRVLHVQSISSWAPSCIGPYSQATLHKNILHMAGQLGLDPPTMILCEGGVTAELEKALQNSEAVAKCFNCSISTSTIVFVIYCSACIPSSERLQIQDKLDVFLKQMKLSHFDEACISEALDPIFLYVLVPDLPKRALVEVKPILFISEDIEATNGAMQDLSCIRTPCYLGFQHASWHDHCIKKYVVPGRLCAIFLYITTEVARKLSFDTSGAENSERDHENSFTEGQIREISRFCIYLLDKVIKENGFSWEDTMYLRLYFPMSLHVPPESLSLMFTNAFVELAAMDRTLKIGHETIFNLVPVLGAGNAATSMNDIFTCELLARK